MANRREGTEHGLTSICGLLFYLSFSFDRIFPLLSCHICNDESAALAEVGIGGNLYFLEYMHCNNRTNTDILPTIIIDM